jgi:hypothetical protein
MINMIGGGGWCGDVIRVFYKIINSFNFCFFLLRRECVGARRESCCVLFSQKYIYFWELMFPEITKD